MAIHEGCRRLRKAGKALIIAAVAFLLLAIAVFSITYGIGLLNLNGLGGMLLAIAAFCAFWGAVVWFLGWVIEGFARPSSNEPDRPANH